MYYVYGKAGGQKMKKIDKEDTVRAPYVQHELGTAKKNLNHFPSPAIAASQFLDF